MEISNTISVSSVSSFLKTIFNYNREIWYRGEESDFKESKLTPSVFREGGYHEANMSISFKCLHHETYKHYTDLQWLCLMQHYNLPTRLLDWTTNPLVALFFAVQNLSSDGFIYSISPNELNGTVAESALFISSHSYVTIRTEIATSGSSSKKLSESKTYKELSDRDKSILMQHIEEHINFPIAIYPEITNHRMIAQSSRFTIHGGDTTGKNKPVKIEECTDIDIFKIPKRKKSEIRQHLETLSIHEGALYPEIEYTANYLKSRYKLNPQDQQP